jgi:hypothetical protein
MRLMLLLWDEYVKEHIHLDEFGTVNNAWPPRFEADDVNVEDR